MLYAERHARALLKEFDIEINGSRPWDIRVHNPKLYGRALSMGSLGFGEAYMDGWWDCDALDELFFRLLRKDIRERIKNNWPVLLHGIVSRLFNLQRKSRAFHIGEKHYDVGNDLYQGMLDRRMVYTCGYWKDAANLDQAQEAKLDLVCKKIHLLPGQRVLDIGCGWGSFAKFAAERYGAHVVGITVSKEQVALGQKLCAGLPVEIRLQDYRDVNETFDHIISLGMFEHVGYRNYRLFYDLVSKNLKDDGLFLLHTIAGPSSTTGTDPWIHKYIFPNSMLPSAVQLARAAEGRFITEDWHNFGSDYDKTLLSWSKNVESAWNGLKDRYSERFHRMWRYYLLSCAGLFRARQAELYQIVYSKHGVLDGYISVR
ncbi:cyclopropane fatty acyl phospholipid synthase [Patescibacteria group bacterium]|uniref:Cyclopropane fatty acyl phospholipid synthase n=1 Tax=candidate division WWE3 bacterium TaxID=2053526 RepID=A0A928Y4J4_UNCKA|nr:cyclopropane fatty acyl phospholipid synthase [candidate division WWE3 bacterium]MCL4733012.1 cyclopropane fatty acyl phospholipid synthase [Patescibacteria group bacterium]MDL1953285.1 cyclopropane fatty acyl phospholipid synthase [Candidatus Uhrbacteria bacterium UHB]RIL00515.1 MAG: cyclopropane fatty acyl phospholipid synthase [Candidatus Uhrbacteria bacterium]